MPVLPRLARFYTFLLRVVMDCTGQLFIFVTSFLTVATPQDKIIEVLEAEIIKLKTDLSQAVYERDDIKNGLMS